MHLKYLYMCISIIFKQGYVMVEHFFRQSELQPVRDSIKMEVGSLAQKLYNAGKIKGKHEL